MQEDMGAPFWPKFQFYFKKGSSKEFSIFKKWVGRRKEPILRYVPKNDEKKLVHKGLNAIVTCCRRRKQQNTLTYLSSGENPKIKNSFRIKKVLTVDLWLKYAVLRANRSKICYIMECVIAIPFLIILITFET